MLETVRLDMLLVLLAMRRLLQALHRFLMVLTWLLLSRIRFSLRRVCQATKSQRLITIWDAWVRVVLMREVVLLASVEMLAGCNHAGQRSRAVRMTVREGAEGFPYDQVVVFKYDAKQKRLSSFATTSMLPMTI